MTLASMQTYLYKRTNTNSTNFANADMLPMLNSAYERVSALARTWFDNYRPTAWTSSDLSTGAATPVLDSNFHELIPLWVLYQYAQTYIPQIAAGVWNEILTKEALLREWYGSRRYKVATVTIASPGVFTLQDHGFKRGDLVSMVTSGALPTGLSVDTLYYVISDGLDDDNFRLSSTKDGTAINTSGSQSGTHWIWVKRTPRLISGHVTRGDSNK